MPYVNGGVGLLHYSDRGSEKANKSRHHDDLGDRAASGASGRIVGRASNGGKRSARFGGMEDDQ
jgi:hypothetical protein